MERKLDGRFLLEGVGIGTSDTYYFLSEIYIYPSEEEMINDTVSECKLSAIMIEWYEQVYKLGTSSVKFTRNP